MQLINRYVLIQKLKKVRFLQKKHFHNEDFLKIKIF